jgi:hypothetical protein
MTTNDTRIRAGMPELNPQRESRLDSIMNRPMPVILTVSIIALVALQIFH